MKKICIVFLQLAFFCQGSFAQKGSSEVPFPKSVIQLKIKPSATDQTIKTSDSPHLVIYNPSIKQGKLLLFLPGTGGIAEKGPDDLLATAIQQGYRVINLSYIDTPSVSTTCIGSTLENDDMCAEKFRIKRIFGENTTSEISDEPQDAIMNRFTKLLIHLANVDKKGNWEIYLENSAPKWDQIAIGGSSQGGGMAAFIAKRILVARVISFSGGWDHAAKNKIARWYFNASVTPPERWYGAYNIAEPTAETILRTYKVMGIPENHIYPLSLPVRKGRKAHGEGIRNAGYKQQWVEMLGVGN